MPFYLIGGKETLSANGSGRISINIPLDGTLVALYFASNGDFEITNMEITSVSDFFDGVFHVKQFAMKEGRYELPEPISLRKGMTFLADVKDLSGAENKVYIGLEIKF